MRTTLALSSLAAVALAQLKTDTFPDCKHGPLANSSVCNMNMGESSRLPLVPLLAEGPAADS